MQVDAVSMVQRPNPSDAADATGLRSTDQARTASVGFADAVNRSSAAVDTAAGSSVAPQWKQLETLLVQQMLQGLLSSEEGGFFGEGLAGDYYSAFMAEHFGARLSDSLDLGIAARLDGQYHGEGR